MLKFGLLADNVWAIPLIAKWYYEDQGHKISGNSYARTVERIEEKLNKDILPLHIIAILDQGIVGVAQLKIKEIDLPGKDHWLGSVYIPEEFRNKGYAKSLCKDAVRMAKNLGITNLYLSTEHLNGGLYTSCGFIPDQEIMDRGDKVLIMKNNLGS